MVGEIYVLYVLFVWSGCYMSCLSGLPFFLPTSFIASVLCTCISMYIHEHNSEIKYLQWVVQYLEVSVDDWFSAMM